jgi:hypothetical protein
VQRDFAWLSVLTFWVIKEISQAQRDQLTSRTRVLYKTILTASHKIPSFYGTQRTITVFKATAFHRSPFWASWNQFTPSHHVSLRFILTLSFHRRLGLPSGFFLTGFPTKIVYEYITMRATYPAHLIFLYLIILLIFSKDLQTMNNIIMLIFPTSCYFLSPGSKYSLRFRSHIKQEIKW